ncbi:MAG: hypothetical protein ACRCRZ_00075 [Metamycoplasmataceae bacterium]
MKQLKQSKHQLKIQLKFDNLYRKYKKTFKNPKYRFIIIQYANIFNVPYSLKLYELEKYLIDNNSIDDFVIVFKEFSILISEKYKKLNWESFGKFIYYVFNYSIFYYDKKNSIYKKNTILNLNDLKKKYYYEWLNSFYETKDINFNEIIVQVLKFSI